MDSDVYLYRYEEKNGEPALDNIDDDEEYEIVADAFDEFLDWENKGGRGRATGNNAWFQGFGIRYGFPAKSQRQYAPKP